MLWCVCVDPTLLLNLCWYFRREHTGEDSTYLRYLPTYLLGRYLWCSGRYTPPPLPSAAHGTMYTFAFAFSDHFFQSPNNHWCQIKSGNIFTKPDPRV